MLCYVITPLDYEVNSILYKMEITKMCSREGTKLKYGFKKSTPSAKGMRNLKV